MKSVLVYNKSFHQKNEIKSRYPLLRSCFSPAPPFFTSFSHSSSDLRSRSSFNPRRPTSPDKCGVRARRSSPEAVDDVWTAVFAVFVVFVDPFWGSFNSREPGPWASEPGPWATALPTLLLLFFVFFSSLLFSSGSSGNQGLVL